MTSVKTALITGITGQDGAYLAELLLQKNYIVHGIKRRSSSFNTGRIDHLYCVCGSSSQSQEEDGEPILDVCWETFQHDYNYMAQLMGCATPSSSTQATPLVAALCVAASIAHFRG